MKIASWNVNGIRAVAKKGFLEWVYTNDFDIVCIQETKAFEDQFPKELESLKDKYSYTWHSGERKGYSGVATFSKIPPLSSKSRFDEIVEFHEEGRVVETKFENFTLINFYVPNGGTTAAGEEKLTYKLGFYDRMINYFNDLRDSGENIIACGDFNIAHTEIDIARPKQNQDSIGFLPIERDKVSELISNGYIDVFREVYPDKLDDYTWWSYRAGARPNNVGWRIDYFFVNSELMKSITEITHQHEILGSDHCPIVLELNF